MSVPEAPPEFDLYALLGVDRRATRAAIEQAYRAQAKRHHPDVAADPVAATAEIKRINLARHWLTDPSLRMRYDRHHGFDRFEVRTDWEPRPMTVDELLHVQRVRRSRRVPYGSIAFAGFLLFAGGILAAAVGPLWGVLAIPSIFLGITLFIYGVVGAIVGFALAARRP